MGTSELRVQDGNQSKASVEQHDATCPPVHWIGITHHVGNPNFTGRWILNLRVQLELDTITIGNVLAE